MKPKSQYERAQKSEFDSSLEPDLPELTPEQQNSLMEVEAGFINHTIEKHGKEWTSLPLAKDKRGGVWAFYANEADLGNKKEWQLYYCASGSEKFEWLDITQVLRSGRNPYHNHDDEGRVSYQFNFAGNDHASNGQMGDKYKASDIQRGIAKGSSNIINVTYSAESSFFDVHSNGGENIMLPTSIKFWSDSSDMDLVERTESFIFQRDRLIEERSRAEDQLTYRNLGLSAIELGSLQLNDSTKVAA